MAITNKLKAIADAIRTKTNTSGTMKLDEMPSKIMSINTGSDIAVETQKTVDVNSNGITTVNPSSGYDAMKKVNVNVNVPIPTFTTETKTVDPSETKQDVVPTNADGLSKVTVNAISSTYVGSGITRQSAKTITPNDSEQTAVSSGVYTTGAVKVSAVPTETKSAVTPTKSQQIINASTGKYMKTLTVNPIPTQYIIPSGSETKTSNGTYDVTSLAELIVNVSGGGGGLPSGISALDFGKITVNSAFTTTRQTFTHKLGVTPDLMIVWSPTNIATTYSMMCAIRGNQFGWRSSAYNNHMAYHGNSTTNITWTNSNSTSYGVSNMTATTFQLASASSSYYWRAGTYNYIAIKFG